jgi:hypothetical protein
VVNTNCNGGVSDIGSLVERIEANRLDKLTFKDRMWRFIKPEIPAGFINVGSTLGASIAGIEDPLFLTFVGPVVEKIAILGFMYHTLRKEYKHNIARGMEEGIAKYTTRKQLKQDIVSILGVDIVAHDTFYSGFTRLMLHMLSVEGQISPAGAAGASAIGFGLGTGAAAFLSSGVSKLNEKAVEFMIQGLDYHRVVKPEHNTRERRFQLEPRLLFRHQDDAKAFFDHLIWLSNKRGYRLQTQYPESQVDTYYDTEARKLLHTASSLKIRQSSRPQSRDESIKLYFDTKATPHERYRSRERERLMLEPEAWQGVLDEQGNAREVFCVEELLEYFSDSLGKCLGNALLKTALIVKNNKTVAELKRNATRFDVVLDEFSFVHPETGFMTGPYYGAEVKLKAGRYYEIAWIDRIIGWVTKDEACSEVYSTDLTKYVLGCREIERATLELC